MGSESGDWAITQEFQTLSIGIIYVILCIACILVLVQRLKRRPHRRQMDSQPSFLEKHGGEQPGCAVDQGMANPKDSSMSILPFPSACDILQPLSKFTPLPSSGYLAAILGRDSNRTRLASEEKGQMLPLTGMTGLESVDLSNRNESSNTGTNESCSSSPAGLGRSSSKPEDLQRTTVGGHDRAVPGIPNLDDFLSVQKRSQTVQFPRVVDSDGARTWRRLIVEYN